LTPDIFKLYSGRHTPGKVGNLKVMKGKVGKMRKVRDSVLLPVVQGWAEFFIQRPHGLSGLQSTKN